MERMRISHEAVCCVVCLGREAVFHMLPCDVYRNLLRGWGGGGGGGRVKVRAKAEEEGPVVLFFLHRTGRTALSPQDWRVRGRSRRTKQAVRAGRLGCPRHRASTNQQSKVPSRSQKFPAACKSSQQHAKVPCRRISGPCRDFGAVGLGVLQHNAPRKSVVQQGCFSCRGACLLWGGGGGQRAAP